MDAAAQVITHYLQTPDIMRTKGCFHKKSALDELNSRKFTIFNVWVIPVRKVKAQSDNLRNLLLVCLMLISSFKKKSVSYTFKTEWKKLPICIDYLLSFFIQYNSPLLSCPFPTFFSKAGTRNWENYRSCKAKQLAYKITTGSHHTPTPLNTIG